MTAASAACATVLSSGSPDGLQALQAGALDAVADEELPSTVHLHHLRHGYAGSLDGAGVQFATVMELLGHAPQGVTWSTCTHRVDGWDRQVRTVLDDAWRGSADHLRTEQAQ